MHRLSPVLCVALAFVGCVNPVDTFGPQFKKELRGRTHEAIVADEGKHFKAVFAIDFGNLSHGAKLIDSNVEAYEAWALFKIQMIARSKPVDNEEDAKAEIAIPLPTPITVVSDVKASYRFIDGQWKLVGVSAPAKKGTELEQRILQVLEISIGLAPFAEL